MNKTNNPTELRQRLETTLDFISRSALGHDTGHCVHFANKAEAELHSVIDELDAALAAIKKQAGIEAVEEAAYSLYGKGYIFDTIMDYATELREAK